MKKKGFTLIELLVVVAIIGILATIVLSSLSDARVRARDAHRISEMKSLETALEIYYLDNGGYPTISLNTSNGSTTNVAAFESAMAPYIKIDLLGKYYRDTSGDNVVRFRYKSKSSQNYQNYGLMFRLEDSTLSSNDGGYFSNDYEHGSNPKYCMDNYTSIDRHWWNGSERCAGGN